MRYQWIAVLLAMTLSGCAGTVKIRQYTPSAGEIGRTMVGETVCLRPFIDGTGGWDQLEAARIRTKAATAVHYVKEYRSHKGVRQPATQWGKYFTPYMLTHYLSKELETSGYFGGVRVLEATDDRQGCDAMLSGTIKGFYFFEIPLGHGEANAAWPYHDDYTIYMDLRAARPGGATLLEGERRLAARYESRTHLDYFKDIFYEHKSNGSPERMTIKDEAMYHLGKFFAQIREELYDALSGKPSRRPASAPAPEASDDTSVEDILKSIAED
ncbi:hypothetical protein ACFL2T_05845 [Elusimicrobiota bacterium]